MTNETIRILQHFLLPTLQRERLRPWQPAVDIYRLATGWLLKFELAGVDPEDITLSIQGRRLMIRGTRLDRHWQSDCSLQHMEIAYSSFERCVELPDDPGAVSLQGEFKNGMLYVYLEQESPT
jgi:HSP20 family molecular chaperone IbpA